MSVNQVRNIRSYTADIDSTHQEPENKKKKKRPHFHLVPQRKNFSSDEIFHHVMEEYISICKRLEMVKWLEDCMKSNEE